jgi:DNA-binding transcriptional LysR family regulator
VMFVPTLFIGGVLDSGLLATLEPVRIRTGSYSYATHARRDSRRVAAFTGWLQQAERP